MTDPISPLQDARKAEWYIKKLVALLKTKPSAGSIKKEYPEYPVDH